MGEISVKQHHVHALGGAIINERLFFSSMNYNGLFRCDVNTWEVKFLKIFEGEDLGCENLFGHVVTNNSKLYFLPIHGKSIHIYDTLSDSMSKIDWIKDDGRKVHISSVVKFRDRYLMIPSNIKEDFYFLLPDRNLIEDARNLKSLLNPFLQKEPNAMCRYNGVCADKDSIYIAVLESDTILEINLFYETLKTHRIGDIKVNNIFFHNENLWITDTSGRKVVKWEKGGEQKTFVLAENEDDSFFSFAPYSSSVIALPWNGKRMLRYNENESDWTEIWKADYENDNTDSGRPLYCSWFKRNGHLLLVPCCGCGVIMIDEETGQIKKIPLYITPEQLDVYKKKKEMLAEDYFGEKTIVNEMMEPLFGLNDFLFYLSTKQGDST